jgi:integrase
VPVISAHPLRHTAATLLLNERGANLREHRNKTDENDSDEILTQGK